MFEGKKLLVSAGVKNKLLRRVAAALLVAASVIGAAAFVGIHVKASQNKAGNANPRVILPLVTCWYKGQQVFYIQTEASDPAVALAQGVNYVPRLANAINTTPAAVDNIYVVTNFKQSNVIPSAPIPTGPQNTDPDYTPLWQVTQVTWNSGTTPRLLTSEEEILSAVAAGEAKLNLTNIVVNCPVIYSPQGGILPKAKILLGDSDEHEQ
jgi:hypothetical protein